MKTSCIQFLFIAIVVLVGSRASAQKLREYRDYSLRDSIPLYNVVDEDRLKIQGTLRISNEFSGNYNINHWYDYRNLTMAEYGFHVKQLPVVVNVGSERGRIYENDFHRLVWNVKFDFQKLIEEKISRFDIRKSMDQFDTKLSEDILKEEVKKKVLSEMKDKWPKEKADSMFNRISEMQNMEGKLKDQGYLEQMKQQKVMLKEYSMGNKIEGVNYDSLANMQRDFDRAYERYQLNQKDAELMEYRSKLDGVMSSKEKMLDIKNKTEDKLSVLKNRWNPANKWNLNQLKIKKFNLGQSSVDNSELVFRGFMIQGLNIELTSPFYFNLVYSLPFQTNLFSNYTVNSIQNNEVSTIGGAIGSNPNKKIATQVGFYQFQEKMGAYAIQLSPKQNIENSVVNMKSIFNFSKKVKSTLEIAKSETNKYGDQTLFSMKDVSSSTAVILRNEMELFQGASAIKLDIQRVGLNFYSSANPFIQRGTGGMLAWNQKIASKWNLKSKASYRYSADSNRDNSNLSLQSALRYKMNRNTTLEAKAALFQNQIEYKELYSYMNTQMISLSWSQRLKFRKSSHQLTTTAQYLRNESRSSFELNNSGLMRTLQWNTTYYTTIGKMMIQANVEDSYQIDSSYHLISDGLNLSYMASAKTMISLGMQTKQTQNMWHQIGGNMSFSTEIQKIILSGTVSYVYDNVNKINILSPQLRMSYQIF